MKVFFINHIWHIRKYKPELLCPYMSYMVQKKRGLNIGLSMNVHGTLFVCGTLT